MIFRKANINDIDSLVSIIEEAKAYFKENKIDQWQDGYPNKQTLLQDIKKEESFLLEQDGIILATCMISTKKDPTYHNIYQGSWLNNEPYFVIHRIAVKQSEKGNNLASFMIQEAIKLHPDYFNIRIDTHKDNISMQRMLQKNGFIYCGIIYLETMQQRNAYQRVIKR